MSLYIPTAQVSEQALIASMSAYEKKYAQSIADPAAFWKTQAEEQLDWIEPFKTVCEGSLAEGHIRWFEGGRLNASTQCIDRHLAQRGQKVALIWESDEPGAGRRLPISSYMMKSAALQISCVLWG